MRADDSAPSRASVVAGYAVALWSLLYLLPHLAWALGVRAGMSALQPSITTFGPWRTINWIASAILALAALIGLALRRRGPSEAAYRAKLTIAWFGSCIATAHGLVGIGMRIETISRWPQPAAPAWLYWDLLVFEPWFLIEGILLALAGGLLLQDRQRRTRWAYACVAGSVVALMLALMRVRIW